MPQGGVNGVNLATNLADPSGLYGTVPARPISEISEGLPKGQVQVAEIDQRNTEYEMNYEAWLDLSLLYTGGAMLKARAERVLKKRPREDEEVYACRLDRFTYQNILGTGLGWYGAALFDVEPEIFFNGKAGSDYYAKFLDDCDGLGTTYVDFFKKVFQFTLTYGRSWVLTDLRALSPGEAPPATLQEERERKLLDPHIAAFTPLNVINWQEDANGSLTWVVLKLETEEQVFLGDRELVTTWYYFDRTDYKVYQYRRKPEEDIRTLQGTDANRTAQLLRQGKHALANVQRVPLRRLELSEGLWLANRVYLQLIDHLNQDNTLSFALFMSNLAMPVIIGDVDTTNMVSSDQGYLQFPAGTTYQWSEPEGKSFVQSAKRVESLREECFRTMNLQAQGRSMRATPAMQSGRSKQLDMAPSKQVLIGIGDDVRRHMQSVLVDVKDARNDEKCEPDVRGFNFQEEMTTEEVFSATSVLNINIPSKTFEKHMLKKIAKPWMLDMNRTELNKVYREIDAGPTLEEQQDADMKRRADLVRSSVRSFLPKPPGRGGDGNSTKVNDKTGEVEGLNEI